MVGVGVAVGVRVGGGRGATDPVPEMGTIASKTAVKDGYPSRRTKTFKIA